MEAFFYFCLKSSLLLSGFYLVYHFLLRKETFFHTNRWFLWLGFVVSLILPFITIVKTVVVEVPLFQLTETLPMSNTAPETFTVDWVDLAIVFYAIGLLFFMMKFLSNLMQLVKTIRKHSFKKINNLYIADDSSIKSPFSFFNFLFLNTTNFSEKETTYIFKHEQAHANGFHSIDLLFANLYTVFFWFNPFAWRYKKNINQNLEYLADEEATASEVDKNQYQLTLLKSLSINPKTPLTHPFYQSFLKTRIVMMNQKKSPKHNAFKYSLMLPLLVLFFLQFQIEVVAQNKSKTVKEKVSEATPPPTTTVDIPTPPPPPAPIDAKPLVVLDGTVYEQDVKDLDSKDIKSVNVLKGEHALKKYGEKGKNGVVEITRIQSNNLPEKALYLIDGKTTTRDAVEKLKPEDLRAVFVLEGEHATKKYGEKGKNGVVEIFTKE